MNISFDAKRAFHNKRGLGNYSRNIIRLLNTYYPEHQYYLLNPKSKNNIPFNLSPSGVEISPQNGLNKLLPDYWRSRGCIADIKALKTDIYHGLSQELPIGIEKSGAKSVVTMHDAIFIRYPELYDRFYRNIFIKKNKHSCKVADHIIAISEQTKQDYIEFFNVPQEKISVVYQGCNNIFREPILDIQKESVRKKYNLPQNYLLNVGAIEKRKNIATVIEAIYRGKIDMPLVVIGGKTDYLNEIKALVEKYKLESSVQFLHNVETVDLPAIYNMAEVFIYPSIFEGFGIPILEALCTSTPVISSKGSCFEETGGKDSLYVHYDNPDEMAEAICKILSDNQLQQTMKEQGLKHAAIFKDEKVITDLMQVYQSVIK